MSSKKVEERNEKIIRGLMKLPPNRRCINCNSLGPQYVCTNFWTFVCITCSGIHREFTHRVKSVSMAKFTSQEVEALQIGGNQRAKETFLKQWEPHGFRFPDSSNVDRIREFIKNVYVDRKYCGGRNSDKPPRDKQNHKTYEDDTRRASSYHSYSQSPPYDHQYEDRLSGGKHPVTLSRKPGSDRGFYDEKISSFVYSPGHGIEQMYEDRFANEGSGSRISDYSASSVGDPFRSEGQSPNFQKDSGIINSPNQPVRDILIENIQRKAGAIPEKDSRKDLNEFTPPQRTSSGNSSKSVNVGSLIDVVSELEPSSLAQSKSTASHFSPFSTSSSSTSDVWDPFNASSFPVQPTSTPSIDFFTSTTSQQSTVFLNQSQTTIPFNAPSLQPPLTATISSVDLFAGISNQQSSIPIGQSHSSVPFSDDGTWTTFFDSPHPNVFPIKRNHKHSSTTLPGDEVPVRNTHSTVDTSTLSSGAQSSLDQVFSLSSSGNWIDASQAAKGSMDPTNMQSWNAFDDSLRSFPSVSFDEQPHKTLQVPTYRPPVPIVQNSFFQAPYEFVFPDSASDAKNLIHSEPFDANISVPFSVQSVQSPMGEIPTSLERKSRNPFESDLESGNVFLDMSSLNSALPNSQFPAFLGGLNQPWPQSSGNPYAPAADQGVLAYVGGQAPISQLPNIPPQGPVASLGGNPFA